jgi:hypothetical protein
MYYSSLDAPPTTSSDFSLLSLVLSLAFYIYIYMQTRRQRQRTVLMLTDWTILSLFIYIHAHTLQLVWYIIYLSFFLVSCCSDRMTINILYMFFSHMAIYWPWESMMRTFIFVVIHADNGIYKVYRWILSVYL